MKNRFINIEKALANEKRLKGILDNLQDGFFEADLKGNFTFVNAVGIEMYGYNSTEELIGMPAKSLYANEKERDMMLEELRKTGKIVDWNGIGLKKDGTTFWVSMNVQVLKNDAGQAIGTQGTVRDISWRKQNEETMRLSEEKFRKAFFTSPDSIAINRLEDGMYVSINKGFTQILDYTEEDVSGKTSLELNIWVDAEDRRRLGQELKDKGFVDNMEANFRGKSGKILDGLMSANIIELGGVLHILSVTRDFTERKKIEKDLIIAKEKAEESDRLKSAFLANMSHEIRTPMNGILGFAELLKEPSLSGEKQQEYIQIIEKAGDRMLNIITDIVDISKIESGQMIVSNSETNVIEQMEYLFEFFKTEAENKGLNLIIRNSLPSSEATIKTDHEKLYAILTNLIKNAIKYTEQGFIEIGCQKKNDLLEFYVKDTGIGVPIDRQQAIFERFIQADITNKMAKQGAGLGLSISKAYVEMLGGKIWMESEMGIGSTFYFTLPYHP
ncbi:MAG: PAS domain-containing sensor histidine kinase [Bacteroidia bacterium]|nr:PAS domain-containing sensor histidine kinase [Bacteroidia bacterium]